MGNCPCLKTFSPYGELSQEDIGDSSFSWFNGDVNDGEVGDDDGDDNGDKEDELRCVLIFGAVANESK